MVRKVDRIVYGLHDGDGVIRYVGRAKYGLHRLTAHKLSATKRDTDMPVHKWMRSRGVDQIFMEVLERFDTDEEMIGKEDYWIHSLKTSITSGGFNVARGDRGGVEGLFISPDTRARMSESAILRIKNESDRDSSQRLATLKKNGLSRPFLGHRHSNKTKELQSRIKTELGNFAGEKNPKAKLDLDSVKVIRSLQGIERAVTIAERYGVSKSNIYAIWRNKVWNQR